MIALGITVVSTPGNHASVPAASRGCLCLALRRVFLFSDIMWQVNVSPLLVCLVLVLSQVEKLTWLRSPCVGGRTLPLLRARSPLCHFACIAVKELGLHGIL